MLSVQLITDGTDFVNSTYNFQGILVISMHLILWGTGPIFEWIIIMCSRPGFDHNKKSPKIHYGHITSQQKQPLQKQLNQSLPFTD